jgi:hypothetical protein
VTLVEFLLARIAEDEGSAGDVHDAYCTAVTQTDHGTWTYEPGGCDCECPARALAWCAAKRRIVELYQQANTNERADCAFVNALEQVVRLLTRSWRDHPDFDPSWQE